MEHAPPPPASRRSNILGARVDRLLAAVLDPVARARGFAKSAILTDWETIAGAKLAARCRPLAVRFAGSAGTGAVLDLAASGGAALELQHIAPQLIERVNGYFGRPVIARLQIVQRPVRKPMPPRRAPVRLVAPEDATFVAARTADIADDPLREALSRLGRTILTAERDAS